MRRDATKNKVTYDANRCDADVIINSMAILMPTKWSQWITTGEVYPTGRKSRKAALNLNVQQRFILNAVRFNFFS